MDPQPQPKYIAQSKKLIKIPALHPKPCFNQIYIKGNRPLNVYIKHSHKVLTKYNTIIIHAMTAAINKAVKLALYLMEQYPYLEQNVFTDSVPTLNVRLKNKQEQIREKQQEISIINKDKNSKQDKKYQEEQVIKQRAAIHIVLTKTLKKQKQTK